MIKKNHQSKSIGRNLIYGNIVFSAVGVFLLATQTGCSQSPRSLGMIKSNLSTSKNVKEALDLPNVGYDNSSDEHSTYIRYPDYDYPSSCSSFKSTSPKKIDAQAPSRSVDATNIDKDKKRSRLSVLEDQVIALKYKLESLSQGCTDSRKCLNISVSTVLSSSSSSSSSLSSPPLSKPSVEAAPTENQGAQIKPALLPPPPPPSPMKSRYSEDQFDQKTAIPLYELQKQSNRLKRLILPEGRNFKGNGSASQNPKTGIDLSPEIVQLTLSRLRKVYPKGEMPLQVPQESELQEAWKKRGLVASEAACSLYKKN